VVAPDRLFIRAIVESLAKITGSQWMVGMALHRENRANLREVQSVVVSPMKTRNIGIWAIATLAASLFAVPTARSATERFSANLVGANEVPPINTAGSGAFRMQIVGSNITFSLSFSDLSSALSVAHLHFAPSSSQVVS
jgi:hypothetical protein